MSAGDSGLRPICFMVMPFGVRKVEDPKGDGAPGELDCNALWDKAFRPALEELGYLPIRADADPGSLIVKDMLERLALADLVLADVSLPNGNVYYEIGLRHVAKQTHCVLLAADWSRQLFDIAQFRSLRYVLRGGDVPEAEAAAIRKLIVEHVPRLAAEPTPYYAQLEGTAQEIARKGVFRDQVRRLSEFQAAVRETRLIDDKAQRKARVEDLLKKFGGVALTLTDVATELLFLVRDALGWAEAEGFIASLPESTRQLPLVREQHLLAVAKLGDARAAIAQLETLVSELGETPERLGLIGGRYKQLWRAAREARQAAKKDVPGLEEERHLDHAIASYQRGMELDYNAYYCSSNLAVLHNARGGDGDEARAKIVDHFVVAACKRALERREMDEWLRPTLLGAAFRAGDVAEARRLVDRIRLEGAVVWQLETTLRDLEDAVHQTRDETLAGDLRAVLDKLHELSPGSS